MDCGTLYEPADISVYVQGKGIVLKEKSLIAFRRSDNKIIAIGTEAELLIGKDPGSIAVISPLRQGMAADFLAAAELFSHLLAKTVGKKTFLKPAVAVCVPQGITLVEKKAIEEALLAAGAGQAFAAEMTLEEFLKDCAAKDPKAYQKYKVIIGIGKDQPERYLRERLLDILQYAGREGISREQVVELLKRFSDTF